MIMIINVNQFRVPALIDYSMITDEDYKGSQSQLYLQISQHHHHHHNADHHHQVYHHQD